LSPRALGSPPGLVIAGELARALGGAAITPLRAAAFAAVRGRHERALADAVAHPRAVGEPPPPAPRGGAPLRIFLSAAEPSGELHAENLARALRAELAAAGAAPPELVGLGGRRLAAAGVRCIGDPVARAAMGAEAARGLGYYLMLLKDVATELRARPFDLVIPVDSPALHVPLARVAQAYGAPVVHFVAPQYWGWAPWRVSGYRKAVDLALTILPFEPAWFEQRGVRTAHVGHPVLDALSGEPSGAAPAGARVLALLPGSRASVLDRHLPWMLAAAARARLALPDLEVVLPHARHELEPQIRLHLTRAGATSWVRLETGRLHRTLAHASAALSVSGTVLLDLLHHRLPTVVVYRLGSPVSTALARRLLTVPWFASVNLLAGREVLPEFGFHGTGPLEEVGGALVRALDDEGWRNACRAGQDEAALRLGPPGAVHRAARYALGMAAERGGRGAG
jgi:lipid-A-disaccharide synthase